MHAQTLLLLAAARGVDLSHVGGTSSKTDGTAARRRRTHEERELGVEVVESALGRGSRVYRRPTWTHQELALAARGLPPLHFLAARFSIAGDHSGYWRLWEALDFWALKFAQRDGWKPLVTGRAPCDARGRPTGEGSPHFYLPKLAQLVLDEDAHAALFAAAPVLYAAYVDCEDDVWTKVLEPRFGLLKGKFTAWVGAGAAAIQARLREQ